MIIAVPPGEECAHGLYPRALSTSSCPTQYEVLVRRVDGSKRNEVEEDWKHTFPSEILGWPLKIVLKKSVLPVLLSTCLVFGFP